ncbi:hypothetical protein [Flavobacterium sp. 3HN19-14]|uniref:hypothetical protein n=1 Tax=Flavobacterium sp. 3HN19-14 TaxID=3448133 RepID=UPI003EE20036
MLNLNVTVTGGIPPMPISVDFTNLNDATQNLSFKESMGFSNNYNFAPGQYTLVISGMNPDGGGAVSIALTGTFQSAPLPNPTYTSGNPTYSAIFYFVI